MNPAQNIQFQLLSEFDSVCRRCGLEYTLFGPLALVAATAAEVNEGDDYVFAVAMTPENVRAYLRVMEYSTPKDRFIEYLGNNADYGSACTVRYGNKNTLYFLPNRIPFQVNHGIYITIIPLRYRGGNPLANVALRMMDLDVEYAIRQRPARYMPPCRASE